jgi:hypothetical protein
MNEQRMECCELERIEPVDVYALEGAEGVVGGHNSRDVIGSREYEVRC